MIVGVTGFATSGKDTVADVLVRLFGFQKISWADELRRDIDVLNPIVGFQEVVQQGHTPMTAVVRYREAIESFGYTDAKSIYPELRRLLQVYGTEVHRDLDVDYWVKRTMGKFGPDDLIVIPDTRFENEAQAVDHLIKVDRPGVGPVNGHASDAGLAFPYATHTIDNDGSFEDLEAKVISWWRSLTV